MIRSRLERAAVRVALAAADPLRRFLEGRTRSIPSVPTRMLVEVERLDRGGLEEAVFQLVTHLDRARFHPVVACVHGGGAVADRLKAQGVQVEILAASEAAYRSLLEREHIGLVNSHYSTFGAAVAHRLGIPNVHVLQNSYTWIDRGGARRLAWRFREIERFIACSTSVARYSQRRFHIPGDRLQVIPNSVDRARLDLGRRAALREETRRELGLDDQDFAFLLMGTYEARKGHRALLQALARTVRPNTYAAAICVGNKGDPGYFAQCQQAARELRIEARVRFLDYTPAPSKFYAAADALVMPSVVEGFSLATLDAAAFALPQILTDVGGARDLLGREGLGILIPGYVDDLADAEPREILAAQRTPPERVVGALADAMARMCTEPEAWRKAAAKGPGVVTRHYEAASVTARYEAVFAATVGG